MRRSPGTDMLRFVMGLMASLFIEGLAFSVTVLAAVNPLHAPPGFSVQRYATGVEDARFMVFSPSGHLIVSSTRNGRIMRIDPDHDQDGEADSMMVLLEGLNGPHGVDLHGGFLYVAEEDAVGRIAFDSVRAQVTGNYTRIIKGLPADGGHSTRSLRVGPGRKLYVTVGSSCNVCIESDKRRAAMLRFNLDGGGGEIYASGLRNSVGFDWRPADGALFATDNGRDMLGDDLPPCELNQIEQGRHYGWPHAYGNNIPDPQFGAGAQGVIANAIPPAFAFRAHNAPLGVRFVRGDGAPPELKGAALVALHGSWNRSKKDGYKVVSLHWQQDGRIEQRDFLWGFLENGEVKGRPVDIAEGADGAFYISDDYADVIYRVSKISR